ncbi:DUF4468 domain-containing protein [Pedobacter sp. CFBP9032]|uniref:DUF4468 domain-containing protein n=1 Tax=Pedobacter sp. CFBP9032 TaxID=3096539 RepID=UPI002A6A99DB|nr:DUF4468 domain-containing protein [Pedobacter sp. CFBP9032]MDY0906255.1 DUF4468 domain-containing protein [Pedobacter sp. CFBP9032]
MKYFFLLVITLFSIHLFAQQKQFATDENGKFIYYKVVDSQKINKEVIIQRTKGFVSSQKKSIKTVTKTDSSIFAKGTLIIDKTVLVVGHPSGEVNYNLTVEARNGKYRFWLTDFEFIPYQRDRYGNFVATTNVGISLGRKVDKLTASQWKDIQVTAYSKVEKLAESLKTAIATDVLVKVPTKPIETISTKKW